MQQYITIMPTTQSQFTGDASKLDSSASVLASTSVSGHTDVPLFIPSATDYLDSDDECHTKAPPVETANVGDWSGSERSEDDDTHYASDDDPVVREYNVFMTSELARNLYLFQYPVRSRNKPYTKAQNSCPVGARLKGKAGLVEVDVPVNVGLNFDQEKGRVWGDVLRKSQQAKENGLAGKAIGARGGKRRKIKGEDEEDEDDVDVMLVDFAEAVKKGRVLNKQTLGSKMQADEAKYMVGIFKNGMLLRVYTLKFLSRIRLTFRKDQLHLTPVNATLQLRPLFHHVDAQLAAERAQTKSLREADEVEKPAQARAVHLTVNQEVSQTMKALRIAEEEEWMKLHWIDQDDDEAWDQYELLCFGDSIPGYLKCGTSKTEYMDWLSGAMMRKKEGGK